jgi:predicted HicB family RNase H-like nuclease
MPPAEPKIPLTVYLPAVLRREVEHQAADAGQTLSTWVERVIASRIKAKVPAQ